MKTLGFQLKRWLTVSAFALSFILFPYMGLALAIDVKDVPNPRQINSTWVTDMAEILDQPIEAQLNQVISQLERQNGTEIAVVTVPETTPAASSKEFTTKLFNYWGIGKKGKDNGVLFLISKGDRRVEIETGYGMEAILPDAKVGNIIETQITPRFKQGDFNGGTLAGTKALVVAIEAPQSSSVSNQPTPGASTPQTALPTQPFTPSQEVTQYAKVFLVMLIIQVGCTNGLELAIRLLAEVGNKRSIEPEGFSCLSDNNHLFFCANCKKQMEKVDDSTIESSLSKQEKVAQQLGSVRFEGWKCPNCSQQLTGLGYHIVAQESNSDRFSKCPTCQELTATRTKKTIEHPTEYSTGKRLIIEECHCCDYHKEKEETIPCLPPPPPPSSSYSGGGSDGSFSGGGFGGGSSFGGGDSGGGSFGGGDSGGGGAGGGW